VDVIEYGISGRNISVLSDKRSRFPIQVRYQSEYFGDLLNIGNTLIAVPGGGSVPLGDLVEIRRRFGPSEIGSENGKMRVTVQANIAARDPGTFSEEARRRIQESVHLDQGMFLEWTGQYEKELHAKKTLQWIIPVAVLMTYFLLVRVYSSHLEALHVLLAIPFALTGGFLFQFLMGYRFSVAVWVGYIALFGVAIQTAVVMVVYLEEAVSKMIQLNGPHYSDQALRTAIMEGAMLRLRPKVMTVVTTIFGLLPILWSTEVGSEIMRPLAVPVIGGMVSSAVHILVLTPAIFYLTRLRRGVRG